MLPLHNPSINLLSSIEPIHTDIKAIHTDIEPIHTDIELQNLAKVNSCNYFHFISYIKQATLINMRVALR